jgi:hypothetical protein
MGIDLKKVKESFSENKGYWFEYPEDEEIQIKVRPLFPEKANELTRKSTKINTMNGSKEIDSEKLAKLTREYIIEDWKGITINDNSECNNEAKEMLSLYCDKIMKFIIIKSSELANMIVTQNQELLKNSETIL